MFAGWGRFAQKADWGDPLATRPTPERVEPGGTSVGNQAHMQARGLSSAGDNLYLTGLVQWFGLAKGPCVDVYGLIEVEGAGSRHLRHFHMAGSIGASGPDPGSRRNATGVNELECRTGQTGVCAGESQFDAAFEKHFDVNRGLLAGGPIRCVDRHADGGFDVDKGIRKVLVLDIGRSLLLDFVTAP